MSDQSDTAALAAVIDMVLMECEQKLLVMTSPISLPDEVDDARRYVAAELASAVSAPSSAALERPQPSSAQEDSHELLTELRKWASVQMAANHKVTADLLREAADAIERLERGTDFATEKLYQFTEEAKAPSVFTAALGKPGAAFVAALEAEMQSDRNDDPPPNPHVCIEMKLADAMALSAAIKSVSYAKQTRSLRDLAAGVEPRGLRETNAEGKK